MEQARIYLDTNATAPLAEEVRRAMEPWLHGRPANPSSVHAEGRAARAAVERARERVAALVGGGDVYFTSGGTEADNWAVLGAAGWPPTGHLVVSSVEHPAILEPAARLERAGVHVQRLAVDAGGRVDPDRLAAALRPDTRLVSVMTANNETGCLQPIAEIACACRAAGVPSHTDAVQAAAWLDLPPLVRTVDWITLSGHKIGGPPGIGALVVRAGAPPPDPLLHGGGQQRGFRPGTEPTALAVGFGAACERVRAQPSHQAARVARLTERLRVRIEAALDGVVVTVTAPRLPNTLHLCFEGVRGDALVARLDLDGVAASAGSACHSGVPHASHVLEAMGVPETLAAGAVRLSLGYHTTEAEIDTAAERIVAAVAAVRAAHATPEPRR